MLCVVQRGPQEVPREAQGPRLDALLDDTDHLLHAHSRADSARSVAETLPAFIPRTKNEPAFTLCLTGRSGASGASFSSCLSQFST